MTMANTLRRPPAIFLGAVFLVLALLSGLPLSITFTDVRAAATSLHGTAAEAKYVVSANEQTPDLITVTVNFRTEPFSPPAGENRRLVLEFTEPKHVSLVDIVAFTSDDTSVPLREVAPGRFALPSTGGADVTTVRYSVRLPGASSNPTVLPRSHERSTRIGPLDLLFLSHLLAHVAEAGAVGEQNVVERLTAATVVFDMPDHWHAYADGIGVINAGEPVPATAMVKDALIVGPMDVFHRPGSVSGVDITIISTGTTGREPAEFAATLDKLIVPFAKYNVDVGSDLTFVFIPYEGAARLNPLISSHIVGSTIVHRLGTGSIDWWLKHAARDLLTTLIADTLPLAADATWFRAGLADYAGSLLLYEAGFLDDDALYHSLRTAYEIGVHYTGPGWPSLILAGISSPRSGDAERVLQFRAPLVAFLLDAELREASAGRFTIIHLWAELATTVVSGTAEQPRAEQLRTADLLPPPGRFGDFAPFAERFIFGTRIPPINFETVFQRWLDNTPVPD